jgi:hypothetical protein
MGDQIDMDKTNTGETNIDEMIEEYQPKDHSNIEFVYDEPSDDAEEQTAPEISEKAAEKAHFVKKMAGIEAVLLALCALAAGIFLGRLMSPKEEPTLSETNMQTEDVTENSSDNTAWQEHDTDYQNQMEAYMRSTYGAAEVRQISAAGRYDANGCLMLDLDGDTSTPEGIGLIWDEEKECYQLFLCDWQIKDGAGDSALQICSTLLTLKDTEHAYGCIDAMIVNYSEIGLRANLIIEMHRGDSSVSSIVLEYAQHNWTYLGLLEGAAALQDAGDGTSRYDLAGQYVFTKPYASISGAKACQYWQISDDALYSDYQIDYNTVYWELQNTPQWYMKRPVVAYGGQDFMPVDQTLQLLEGESLCIIGVYEDDGDALYQVETDTGQRGYIVMNNPEKGTQAQMQLQSLPFEEVFSETEISDEELMADAYTPKLPVISGPVDMTLQPGDTYSAWIDLNGDGSYEKLEASSEWQPNKEGVKFYLQVGGIRLLNDIWYESDAVDLQMLVMDLDTADQWLEVGYYLHSENRAEAELYRYDGRNVRSLGIMDGLCFGGTPDINQMLEDGDGTLQVRGSWSGCDFSYSIVLDPQTGMVDRAGEIFLEFDEPVSCKPRENTRLYDGMDKGTRVDVKEDESLQLIGIDSVMQSDGIRIFYGCVELEDGTRVYTDMMETYFEIVIRLNLEETFGALAG